MLQDFILRNGVMSLGGMTFPYAAKTANYTLTDEDYFIDCTSNTFTVTLPTAVGRAGQIYVIKNSGTGTITVATASAQTIDGSSTKSLSQYNVIILSSNGSNWAINSGPGRVNYTASTSAPVSPSQGDNWYDPVNAILFVYINDGNTSQWVEACGSSGSSGSSGSTDPFFHPFLLGGM